MRACVCVYGCAGDCLREAGVLGFTQMKQRSDVASLSVAQPDAFQEFLAPFANEDQ